MNVSKLSKLALVGIIGLSMVSSQALKGLTAEELAAAHEPVQEIVQTAVMNNVGYASALKALWGRGCEAASNATSYVTTKSAPLAHAVWNATCITAQSVKNQGMVVGKSLANRAGLAAQTIKTTGIAFGKTALATAGNKLSPVANYGKHYYGQVVGFAQENPQTAKAIAVVAGVTVATGIGYAGYKFYKNYKNKLSDEYDARDARGYEMYQQSLAKYESQ